MRHLKHIVAVALIGLMPCLAYAQDGKKQEKPESTETKSSNGDKKTTPKQKKTDAGDKKANESENQEVLFRGHEWGASRKEIKKKEGKPAADNEIGVTYKDTLAGLDVAVVFNLHEDAFFQAGYMVLESYANNEKHLRDYRQLQTILEEKYGSPTESIRDRDDNEYTDEETELMSGELMYLDVWQKGDVEITHSVSASNYKVSHMVSYENKKVAKDADKKAKDKTKDKL